MPVPPFLKIFLLLFYEFHLMHTNPIHTYTCSYQLKEEKKVSHGSCSVSRCFIQYALLSKQLYLQMFIAMSLWSGLRNLVSATLSILDSHLDSSQIFCYYPMSWRSYILGSATPSYSTAVCIWGRCWGGLTQSPRFGPGWELSWSFNHLSCTHTTSASSTILPC